MEGWCEWLICFSNISFQFYALASITVNTLFINSCLFFNVEELKKTFLTSTAFWMALTRQIMTTIKIDNRQLTIAQSYFEFRQMCQSELLCRVQICSYRIQNFCFNNIIKLIFKQRNLFSMSLLVLFWKKSSQLQHPQKVYSIEMIVCRCLPLV